MGKLIESLDDAIRSLIHDSPVTPKTQAEDLGISYTRLVNVAVPTADTYFHHTRWIIPHTKSAKNFVLVDYIERRLGRVAVSLKKIKKKTPKDALMEFMRITKEMGDLAKALEKGMSKDSEAGEDLGEQERKKLRKEVWDLIQEAVTFYKMMEDEPEEED